MPPKRRLIFSSSSSGNSPPIRAPAHQGRDGEETEVEDSGDQVRHSDDLGLNNTVLPPPPPLPAQGGREGPKSDGKLFMPRKKAKSPPRKTGPTAEGELTKPAPSKTKMSPEAHLTKCPQTQTAPATVAKHAKSPAAAKQLTKPPPPKKADATAATTTEIANQVQVVVLYNAEKHLAEKSARYWYLKRELQALEADLKQPGMFDAAFLKIADAKATELDNQIKAHKVAEMEVLNNRWVIKKEVTTALFDSMN